MFAIELTILTNEIGAICKWVQAKPNNGDSYAKLLVDETVADYQIPGLIFNYQDIASFATVVPFENFTNLYSKNKTELYPTILGSDGKLVIDSADGDSVDELKFWTGIINRENTFLFLSPSFTVFTLHEEFQLYVALLFSRDLVSYITIKVILIIGVSTKMVAKGNCLSIPLRNNQVLLVACRFWSTTISVPGISITILTEFVLDILSYTSYLLYCIWFILSVAFYIITKKKLKFLPFNTDIGSTDKVFRHSKDHCANLDYSHCSIWPQYDCHWLFDALLHNKGYL